MYEIDKRLTDNAALLIESCLSNIYLKNNANYPWVLLVPRLDSVKELYQLDTSQQAYLMREITNLSDVIMDYFKPDKLNIGALGNIVSQLHIHIVARYQNDLAWPHSIWQPELDLHPFAKDEFGKHTESLRLKLQSKFKLDYI